MSRLLLLTRPQPALAGTARAARRKGFSVIAAPLQSIQPLPWQVSGALPEALLFTSANAPPLAADQPTLRALPAWCVGRSTAAAARRAGFAVAATGSSDGSAIVARAAAAGVTSLWHIGGQDRAMLTVPQGLSIAHHAVYAAPLATALPRRAIAALEQGRVLATLLFSPRAAGCFARLVTGSGLVAGALRIVALSPAVAKAAGDGWAAIEVAERPTAQAGFAAAERLWQGSAHGK